MIKSASVSIDVDDIDKAVNFYTEVLGCVLKTRYSEDWIVVSAGALDLHLQAKAAGSRGAGAEERHYQRHWTPVHLDFSVDDIRPLCQVIEQNDGLVEKQTFAEAADIAECADPFGNGFCVIRE